MSSERLIKLIEEFEKLADEYNDMIAGVDEYYKGKRDGVIEVINELWKLVDGIR